MSKKYKTHEELINHLINDRNIAIKDNQTSIFSNVRYNDTIDAYKDIIGEVKRGKYIYPVGTTLDDFLVFNDANTWLSVWFYLLIDRYENILKHFISETICQSMVNAGSVDCCDYSLFDIGEVNLTPKLKCFISASAEYVKKESNSEYLKLSLCDSKKTEARKNTFQKIKDLGMGNNKNELSTYAKDYFENKGLIPFYILVGSLSFSNLVIIFEMFTKEIQLEFLKSVLDKTEIKEIDILSYCKRNKIIRLIRNVTHHHEPVIQLLIDDGHLDYNTKKVTVCMLKKKFDGYNFLKNPTILYNDCFDGLNKYTSKKAKRIREIISILK